MAPTHTWNVGNRGALVLVTADAETARKKKKRFPIQSVPAEVHSKKILSNAVLSVRKQKFRKHSFLNLKLKKGFLINNYF